MSYEMDGRIVVVLLGCDGKLFRFVERTERRLVLSCRVTVCLRMSLPMFWEEAEIKSLLGEAWFPKY